MAESNQINVIKGRPGDSLYLEAVRRGLFSGTFEEFRESQRGEPGESADNTQISIDTAAALAAATAATAAATSASNALSQTQSDVSDLSTALSDHEATPHGTTPEQEAEIAKIGNKYDASNPDNFVTVTELESATAKVVWRSIGLPIVTAQHVHTTGTVDGVWTIHRHYRLSGVRSVANAENNTGIESLRDAIQSIDTLTYE